MWGSVSENRSVSGVTSIYFMQRNSSTSDGVDQAVECCPTPLQWLCEVAGYWRELEHAVYPEHPKHARWVMSGEYAGQKKNWDIFSFQELCTDPYNMGPCIIMLKDEMMTADEWHDYGPQVLIKVSLHSNCHR